MIGPTLASFEPAFSPDIYSYRAEYDIMQFDDDVILTVTATPADNDTEITIVSQKYSLADGYTDYETITNGGSFDPIGISRLKITCENDGLIGTYYVDVRMYDNNPRPRD